MDNKQKGQIFSLDFLLAMGMVVLAIGLMLNFYELNANYAKEERVKSEITAIAINATEVLLSNEKCDLQGGVGSNKFNNQGYEVFGCAKITKNAPPINKDEIMIPEGYSCRAEIDGDLANGDCISDYTGVSEVVILDRTFMYTNNILKKDEYEECIDGAPSCQLNERTLRLAVWRT